MKEDVTFFAERKLFVGMLNKKLNENDVRSMFTKFGPIEDCQVLRDGDGKSRGAFSLFSPTHVFPVVFLCALTALRQRVPEPWRGDLSTFCKCTAGLLPVACLQSALITVF